MTNKYYELIKKSAILGFVLFFCNYLILSLWQDENGFTLIELSFIPIITGFLYFFLVIIFNAYFTNKFVKNNLDFKFKKWILLVIILSVSFISFVIFDSLMFLFDNSISHDYAEGLKNILERDNQDTSSIKDFYYLPNSIQNGIVTLLLGVISSLFSLLFVKKNGKLF
jgi:hypothetical protein